MERLFSSALRKKDVRGGQSMWRCWKPARCEKLGQHCMNEQCQDCGVFFLPQIHQGGRCSQKVDLVCLGLTKRGRGLRICARGDAGGMPAFHCPKPARSFQSLSFHAGLWGPAGPIHSFLDGPPSRLPPWPPFQPLRPLCCSCHKHGQPLGLCTGCSHLECSSPSNLLGLSPWLLVRTFLCTARLKTAPAPAPHHRVLFSSIALATALLIVYHLPPQLAQLHDGRVMGWFVHCIPSSSSGPNGAICKQALFCLGWPAFISVVCNSERYQSRIL